MNIGERVHVGSSDSPMDLWRRLQQILAAWRDAERRLALAEPGSAEHARVSAEVADLREQYQRAYSIVHPGDQR